MKNAVRGLHLTLSVSRLNQALEAIADVGAGRLRERS